MFVKMWLIGLSIAVATLIAWTTMGAAPDASGQGDPRNGDPVSGPGGMGGMALLRSGRVQAELKLTEDQKTQVQQLLDSLRNEVRELLNGLKELSEDQRPEKLKEIQEQLEKGAPERADRIRQQIETILRPEQLKRFRQIELREGGPWTLLRPDVVEAISLTDSQKKQLQQISRETQENIRALAQEKLDAKQQSSTEKVALMQAKVHQVRKQGLKKAATVLTRQQAMKLVELMGEPLRSATPPFSPHRATDKEPQPNTEQPSPQPPAAK